MNRTLYRVIALSTLLTATTSTAFAHTDDSERGTLHWLDHLQASAAQPSERQLAPYGYETTGAPERTIVIDKDTRYVNVVQLETVAIRTGDKVVNWTFDAYPRRSFPLSRIVPGTDGVTVHVEESPMYRGS